MTNNINLQKQGKMFYLHFDSNGLRYAFDLANNVEINSKKSKIKCFDIELSEKELERLKTVLN